MVVRFGRRFGVAEYVACWVAALVVPVVLSLDLELGELDFEGDVLREREQALHLSEVRVPVPVLQVALVDLPIVAAGGRVAHQRRKLARSS